MHMYMHDCNEKRTSIDRNWCWFKSIEQKYLLRHDINTCILIASQIIDLLQVFDIGSRLFWILRNHFNDKTFELFLIIIRSLVNACYNPAWDCFCSNYLWWLNLWFIFITALRDFTCPCTFTFSSGTCSCNATLLCFIRLKSIEILCICMEYRRSVHTSC